MSLNSSVDDSFEDSSDGSFEDSPLPVLTNMVISEPAETTEPSDGFVLVTLPLLTVSLVSNSLLILPASKPAEIKAFLASSSEEPATDGILNEFDV